MNRNIFSHEVRIRWRSVGLWLGGVLGLHLLYLPLYAAFADQADLIARMMTRFPPEFLAAFGLNGVDMGEVLGYYSLVFSLVQLCLAIQAANYGFGLLSVEEAELTADFLLTKPLSRGEIWLSKVAAAFGSLLLTQAGVWMVAFLTVSLFREGHPYDPGLLGKLLFSLLPFQLVFFASGLALSMLVRRIRSVTPWGLGLGFGMYVLNAFSGSLGETWLEWVTPFRHFDAPSIVQSGEYGALSWLSAALTAVGLIVAWWRYLHRDIPSAT